ncbi:hypothetical protein SAMN05445504_3614 [Burkholderia sp. CF099]|nr:hypothetical protein SAMN05445504_3614 [Burkholderia sp. CF099]
MKDGEEREGATGRGFAGLSSHVSDVDTTLPPEAGPACAEATASKAHPPSTTSKPETPHASSAQSSDSSGSNEWFGILVVGVFLLIGVLWIVGESNKRTPSSTAPSSEASSIMVAVPVTPSLPPPVPSHPEEAPPPVGQNLLFSIAQIRYCLAEQFRLDGARTAADSHSSIDVERFNALVGNYNSRCASFRYQNGELEQARQEVEPYRNPLVTEGRQLFAPSLPGGNDTSPTQLATAKPPVTANPATQANFDVPAADSASTSASSSADDTYGTTYQTSFDCSKARSVPELLICHDPDLAAADRQLGEIFQQAKASATDQIAFAARTRKQWNYREKNCRDKPCLTAWYTYQIAVLSKVAQTGDVNAQ